MTLNQAIDNLMGREYDMMGDVIRDVADEAYRHVFSLLDNEFLAHELGDPGRIAALVERTLADALRAHFGNTGHAA